MSIAHGDGNPVWLENNLWIQGVGLEVEHTAVTLKCNTWLECGGGAIHATGDATLCMASECGGGGNLLDLNSWHFWLSDAPLPLMSGANHMGWAFDGFAHGTTSNEVASWTVAECSWDPSWGMGLWTGEVPSSLSGPSDGSSVGANIPVFASDPRPRSPCKSAPAPVKPPKKSQPSGLWNLLGQELRINQQSNSASKADK
jgi:hypothetical protein